MNVSFGVSLLIRPDYGNWLQFSRLLESRHIVGSADVSIEAVFRVTNNIYLGGEVNFMADAQALSGTFRQIGTISNISSYTFLPSLVLSYNTSNGFSENSSWVVTGGVGGLISLLQDYFPLSPYASFGGTIFIKAGFDGMFSERFRGGVEVGIRGGLGFPYYHEKTGPIIIPSWWNNEAVELSAGFVSVFFKIVLRFPFK